MYVYGFLPPVIGLLCRLYPFDSSSPMYHHHMVSPPSVISIMSIMNDMKKSTTIIDLSFSSSSFINHDPSSMSIISVPPSMVWQQSLMKLPIPSYHMYSRLHYERFVSSKFSTQMTYSQFCCFEQTLSQIVQGYVQDTSRSFTLLLDPIFLYDDSLPSFLTLSEKQRTLWVTPETQMSSDCVLWKFPSSPLTL